MLYALCSMLCVCAANADFEPFFDDAVYDDSTGFGGFDNFDNFDVLANNVIDEVITDAGGVDLSVAKPVYLNKDSVFAGVMQFDIAGVMLGMDFESVYNQFFRAKSLYAPRSKNSIIYSVSRDWKNNLDYECRLQKIFAPSSLANCINSLAKARGLLYASEMHLVRESTGETIAVYFTSNMTGNAVWRVEYNNDVDEIKGDDPKFADQREKKILAFWQGVLDKYGAPNSDGDKWISSDNTFDPMMVAYYGRLELINAGLNAWDAAENIRHSRENFKAKPYFF